MNTYFKGAAVAAILVLASVSPAFASGSGSGGGGGGSTVTTSTGGGGGGGGGSVACTAIDSATAQAGYQPGAMVMSVGYYLAPCVSGRTVTTYKFVNVASGLTEYQLINTSATSTVWGGAAFDTDYRVEITVSGLRTGGVQTIGTQKVLVHTPVAAQNCAVVSNNDVTAGYWLTFAAIWAHYAISDCGYGRETALMRITNLDTGAVVANYGLPISSGIIDYEGAQVAFDANYQIEVEVHGVQNELLDSKTSFVHTPVGM